MGGGMPKKDPPKHLKADLPHIRCPVCKQLAKEAFQQSATILDASFKATTSPKRKSKLATSDTAGEKEVEEMLESVCDAASKQGRWVTRQDIVQDGGMLKLEDKMKLGHCKRECKTVEKACSMLMEQVEDNDVASTLYLGIRDGMSAEKFERRLCNKWSNACKSKKPVAVKERKDYEWEERSEEDAKMDDMMATMKQAGLGGTLYNRDDIASMVGEGKEEL